MGDESGPNASCTVSSIREGELRSRYLQYILSRLPSGPGSISRKRQMWAEPYETSREFNDPDPGRSHLCYECKTLMSNLHGHPWSDDSKVQIPIGQTDNPCTIGGQRYQYRSLRVVDGCALCSMILEIIRANFLPNSEYWSSISRWRYVLKPTDFGEVFDFNPQRSLGQRVSKTKTRYAHWYLRIEINDSSGHKIPRLVPNAIQGAIRPLPKSSGCIYTGREQAIFERRAF